MGSSVDIENDKFIGLFFVEDLYRIDWISDVSGGLELDGLHQTTVLHKQAGRNARSEHPYSVAKFCNRRVPKW